MMRTEEIYLLLLAAETLKEQRLVDASDDEIKTVCRGATYMDSIHYDKRTLKGKVCHLLKGCFLALHNEVLLTDAPRFIKGVVAEAIKQVKEADKDAKFHELYPDGPRDHWTEFLSK
jgi:hypothetical protein